MRDMHLAVICKSISDAKKIDLAVHHWFNFFFTQFFEGCGLSMMVFMMCQKPSNFRSERLLLCIELQNQDFAPVANCWGVILAKARNSAKSAHSSCLIAEFPKS